MRVHVTVSVEARDSTGVAKCRFKRAKRLSFSLTAAHEISNSVLRAVIMRSWELGLIIGTGAI